MERQAMSVEPFEIPFSEAAVRDLVQRAALANRRYGYRRIAAQLRREGFVVNAGLM